VSSNDTEHSLSILYLSFTYPLPILYLSFTYPFSVLYLSFSEPTMSIRLNQRSIMSLVVTSALSQSNHLTMNGLRRLLWTWGSWSLNL